MKLDMKIQIKKDFQHFNEMVLISVNFKGHLFLQNSQLSS